MSAVDMLSPEAAGALRDEHENPGCCAFFACPGPDVEPIPMATCSFCGLMAELAKRAGREVKSADAYYARLDAQDEKHEGEPTPVRGGPVDVRWDTKLGTYRWCYPVLTPDVIKYR